MHLAFARFGVRSSFLKGADLNGQLQPFKEPWKLMEVFGTFGGLGKEKDRKRDLPFKAPSSQRTASSLQAFKAQFMGNHGEGWPDGSVKGSGGAREGIWEAIGERKGTFVVLI